MDWGDSMNAAQTAEIERIRHENAAMRREFDAIQAKVRDDNASRRESILGNAMLSKAHGAEDIKRQGEVAAQLEALHKELAALAEVAIRLRERLEPVTLETPRTADIQPVQTCCTALASRISELASMAAHIRTAIAAQLEGLQL